MTIQSHLPLKIWVLTELSKNRGMNQELKWKRKNQKTKGIQLLKLQSLLTNAKKNNIHSLGLSLPFQMAKQDKERLIKVHCIALLLSIRGKN